MQHLSLKYVLTPLSNDVIILELFSQDKVSELPHFTELTTIFVIAYSKEKKTFDHMTEECFLVYFDKLSNKQVFIMNCAKKSFSLRMLKLFLMLDHIKIKDEEVN